MHKVFGKAPGRGTFSASVSLGTTMAPPGPGRSMCEQKSSRSAKPGLRMLKESLLGIAEVARHVAHRPRGRLGDFCSSERGERSGSRRPSSQTMGQGFSSAPPWGGGFGKSSPPSSRAPAAHGVGRRVSGSGRALPTSPASLSSMARARGRRGVVPRRPPSSGAQQRRPPPRRVAPMCAASRRSSNR